MQIGLYFEPQDRRAAQPYWSKILRVAFLLPAASNCFTELKADFCDSFFREFYLLQVSLSGGYSIIHFKTRDIAKLSLKKMGWVASLGINSHHSISIPMYSIVPHPYPATRLAT